MTERDQAWHDARHPGMVCQYCPKTVESQRRLREMADRLRRPGPPPQFVALAAVSGILWLALILVAWWRA